MSRHNYSQYSDNKKHYDQPVDVVSYADPNMFTVTPTVAVPEIQTVEETVETVALPETVTGTVINCTKLNVRAEPDAKSDVLCVLDVKSEIKIDVDKSSDKWFRVCTATGIEGYCMRQYINAYL